MKQSEKKTVIIVKSLTVSLAINYWLESNIKVPLFVWIFGIFHIKMFFSVSEHVKNILNAKYQSDFSIINGYQLYFALCSVTREACVKSLGSYNQKNKQENLICLLCKE